MYRWLVQKLIRLVFARLRAGDLRPALAMAASGVRVRFLGEGQSGAGFSSRDELRGWLERYVQAGLNFTPHEIAVTGPPWNTVVFIRYTNSSPAEDGAVEFGDEGVLFQRVAWFRVREHFAYDDPVSVNFGPRWR